MEDVKGRGVATVCVRLRRPLSWVVPLKSRSVEVKAEPEHVKVLSTGLDMDMDKLEEETTQGIWKWSTEGGKAI